MTIRFLQMTPSEAPDHPFMPGQVIHVQEPTPFLLSLLDGVRAEAVREAEAPPETAVARAPRPARQTTRSDA